MMIWRKRFPSQKNILVSWQENKLGVFEGRNEARDSRINQRDEKRSLGRYSGPWHAGPYRHGGSLDSVPVAVGNL